MLIFLILLIFFNSIESCEIFETKRICECSLVYEDESSIRIKLFSLSSYEDCGLSLKCDSNDCKKKCLTSIRKVLGNNENYVNLQAKNKLCELISPNNEAKNKIFAWANWEYSGCNSGLEPLVQDMCCNNKCKCSLNSQIVSKNISANDQKVVLSFQLPSKEKSFECSLNILEECQIDCMSIISDYFNEPTIKNPSNKILNYNIFFNDFSSNKICQALNADINKPGTDIYAAIDTRANNNLIKYIALGRVCCKKKCDCRFIFQDANNSSQIIYPPSQLASFQLNTIETNQGYECFNELNNCVDLCRKKGIELANSLNPSIDTNKTTLDLDILNVNGFMLHLCNLIGIKRANDTIGFNVYLRYSLNSDKFPYSEDLHIGRLCCLFTFNKVLGFNRCQLTTPNQVI